MTTKPLSLAVPSKGRLMEQTEDLFKRAGLTFSRTGEARGYQAIIEEMDAVEISFLSAAEIALSLRDGTVDLGVTGEDLLRESIPPADESVTIALRLGFGPADVVVAVPECWLDVATMSDLDEVSAAFYEKHGRRLRVATKYTGLTRRFFAEKGVTGYRIAESLGATEGAPAAGSAEIIVDITTTGSTLKANQLKILDDGLILRSEAVLAIRREIAEMPRMVDLKARLNSAI